MEDDLPDVDYSGICAAGRTTKFQKVTDGTSRTIAVADSGGEVAISREGEDAIIDFHDPVITTTYLKIGIGLERTTDEQILGVFNSTITAMQ